MLDDLNENHRDKTNATKSTLTHDVNAELYIAEEHQRPTNSVPSFTTLHKQPTMHEVTAHTNGVSILGKRSPEHEGHIWQVSGTTQYNFGYGSNFSKSKERKYATNHPLLVTVKMRVSP
nr:hypothetical protein Iba_chr14fCG1550 [Ipomoea batatas]